MPNFYKSKKKNLYNLISWLTLSILTMAGNCPDLEEQSTTISPNYDTVDHNTVDHDTVALDDHTPTTRKSIAKGANKPLPPQNVHAITEDATSFSAITCWICKHPFTAADRPDGITVLETNPFDTHTHALHKDCQTKWEKMQQRLLGSECARCHLAFTKDNRPCELRCAHNDAACQAVHVESIYHEDCIKNFLPKDSICPVCEQGEITCWSVETPYHPVKLVELPFTQDELGMANASGEPIPSETPTGMIDVLQFLTAKGIKTDCSICLVEFTQADQVLCKLGDPCTCKTHVYHTECISDHITKHITRNPKCPFCRQDIEKEKITNIFDNQKIQLTTTPSIAIGAY